MTQKLELVNSVSNLWGWLSTWLDDDGGLHGYIVHHHRDCFRVLAPDTWTQSPSILGLITLYEKTRNENWLNLAKKLSDFLIHNYIEDLHVFCNSNHEKKSLGQPNLIGNALSSYALLKFALIRKMRGEEWQRYYQVAKDNIVNFIFSLWDKHVRAFSGWPNRPFSHIHNMNSAAIMALTALSAIESTESYIKNYAIPAAEYTIKCQEKAGKLAGAYPYADRKRNYISLYTLITSLGLLTLHTNTGNKELLESAASAVKHLTDLLDQETFLISHYWKMKYPQWIPDTLLFVLTTKYLEEAGIVFNVNSDKILQRVLERQYVNGAFPLSVGFARRGLRKSTPTPNKTTLRDALPTSNWNSWNFWVLCELLPPTHTLPKPEIKFPLIIETDPYDDGESYRIIEHEDLANVMTQEGNKLMAVFDKKQDVCKFSLLEEDLPSTVLRKINGLPRIIRKPIFLLLRV